MAISSFDGRLPNDEEIQQYAKIESELIFKAFAVAAANTASKLNRTRDPVGPIVLNLNAIKKEVFKKIQKMRQNRVASAIRSQVHDLNLASEIEGFTNEAELLDIFPMNDHRRRNFEKCVDKCTDEYVNLIIKGNLEKIND